MINKHLINQAQFLCLVRNDSNLESDSGNSSFTFITKLLKGFRNISSNLTITDFVSYSLLAYQLANNKDLVIRAVNSILEKASKHLFRGNSPRLIYSEIEPYCSQIAAESPSFFTQLINSARRNNLTWHKPLTEFIAKTGHFHLPISGELLKLHKPVSLLGIIKRADNPFSHENAALALISKLMEQDWSNFKRPVDIANCRVQCDDWSKIQSLEVDIELEICYIDNKIDDHFPTPDWVDAGHLELYHIGAFLRSCLIGSLDWSQPNSKDTNTQKTIGIKTSFFARQFSMMHSPEALNGESAPMSSWVSSLLFHILQWPGTPLQDGGYSWPKEWNKKTFSKLIDDRVKYQRTQFCRLSEIPAYVEKVHLDWPKDKQNLNVVMVQSLLPLKTDFADHGLMLDTAKYKARHRRHVASVAELIMHQAFSQNSINDDKFRKTEIDLIIWPELAVNKKDMDILKQLADKTNAIILTGLTFLHLPHIAGPNNVAKWIIPQKSPNGRQYMMRLQGKQNMMADEVGRVKPWRPYQLIIELIHPAFPDDPGFKLTSSICYDATDIKLTADLKDKSNAYLIPALNKDVNTFDSMVDALYYHMYQHVILVNTGEFGGSVAKAPYKEHYEKLITHVHGTNQVSISTFELNMFDFRNAGKSFKSGKKLKTKPAG
jgi:hypothetical protein